MNFHVGYSGDGHSFHSGSGSVDTSNVPYHFFKNFLENNFHCSYSKIEHDDNNITIKLNFYSLYKKPPKGFINSITNYFNKKQITAKEFKSILQNKVNSSSIYSKELVLTEVSLTSFKVTYLTEEQRKIRKNLKNFEMVNI